MRPARLWQCQWICVHLPCVPRRYRKNEVFIDVFESVNLLLSHDGARASPSLCGVLCLLFLFLWR